MKSLKGHKRIAENDFTPSDFLHIVFNIFRVGSDNGTVIVVVGLMELIPFIEKRRIENKVHMLFDQPGNMAVGQFGRITFRLTGDGFDAQLINLSVRDRDSITR